MENIEGTPVPQKAGEQRRVGALLGVFLLGCVIGARYLPGVEACKYVFGLLPPYHRNVAGDYRDPTGSYRKLTKGLTKGQVVDLLSIGQTDVVAGNQLGPMVPGIMHGPNLHDVDIASIVEVWRIPARTEGITSYVYLAFDKAQRLDSWGVSEFMYGFPADRKSITNE